MASANTKKNDKETIEENELYNTPLIALDSFYEQYPEVIDQYDTFYDPASGIGSITEWLKLKDKHIISSDIVDYGYQDFIGDFLTSNAKDNLFRYLDCIIINPPFTLTAEFIDKALEYGCDILMFNRMATIESRKRAEKFHSKEWNLECMYQFAFRVSCTKGIARQVTSNSVAYSWYKISSKPSSKSTKLKWII
jgi:hypothetical protein